MSSRRDGYDGDGFKIVSPRRRKGGANKGVARQIKSRTSPPPEVTDIECAIRTIKDRASELSSSRYGQLVSEILKSNFSSSRRIACYGLGNFGSCSNSSYQLALLLNIRDQFECGVSIYDPAFLESEKTILKELGFSVNSANDEGKFNVETEQMLFYMIHCGKPMYNNVLWANWEPQFLGRMAVLGNSFAHIKLVNTRDYLSSKLRYVSLILPATTEIEIPNIFKRDDVFNNISLHLFKESDVQKLDQSVWLLPKEPLYDSDDEIIRKVDTLKLLD